MALEYSNMLIFSGNREDLRSIQNYISTIAKADEDKPQYDLTMTVADGVVEMAVEPPIPLLSDVRFATRGARLACCVNSRHAPSISLTTALSHQFPAVAIGHTFWADYGERHGYLLLVAGQTKGSEYACGFEWPEEDETGELGDAAAAETQKRYSDAIEALLSDFEK
jgi:hypothetical protein